MYIVYEEEADDKQRQIMSEDEIIADVQGDQDDRDKEESEATSGALLAATQSVNTDTALVYLGHWNQLG